MAETFNLADYYLFDRIAQGRGNHPAILFGEQRHSYRDVADKTRALSAHLIAAGVGRGQRVLIVLHDTPAFVWSLFATLRAGCIVAMGNPNVPAKDLAYLVEYTRAGAIITTPKVAAAIASSLSANHCHVIVTAAIATGDEVLSPVRIPSALPQAITLADALRQGADPALPDQRHTHRDDPAMWLFTSGSTGRSKAAMHAHRDFAFNTERYAINTVGYTADDITVSVPRLFFGYATGTNLLFPFRVGATTALFTERPTADSLAAAIERHQPTIVTNVPTMMGKLLDDDDSRVAAKQPSLDMSSVRFHLSAGEALPPALLSRFTQRFGGEVYDGIGSAEMFHIYCSNRPGDVKPGSLGRAVEGYTLRILPVEAEGAGAAAVASGETGVMWVKGDSVAFGYYQDREKSWSTFHGHWCRTGDLFRVDSAGYHYFEGRADNLLKVGGIWVAPVEVEKCLMEHDAISAAAVIGAPFDGLIKPKAFVVLREQSRQAAAVSQVKRAALIAALKEHVQARLSKHKYPRHIVILDELPKNDRGKVDKKALKQRDAAGEWAQHK
ncbi:MAG TPA: benzoate-CoA ligase family protein [Sorangium sp.]|nr:benzoate-CoA ligase family protein [Sorangium sp.]